MQNTPPPPPRKRRKPSSLWSNSSGSKGSKNHPKYRLISWIVFVLVSLFLVFNIVRSDSSNNEVPYSSFLENVAEGCVEDFKYNNDTGTIQFILKSTQSSGSNCSVGGLTGNLITSGPVPLPDQHVELIREQVPEVRFVTPEANFFISMIPLILPIGLLILFFWWMQRKAQGQVGSIMSIGRSRAKTYATERPDTTFDDVAGYENVKQEITEVVDFLKKSHSFVEIGARVPKGVLLVGPPGTGKTLIAKAVAGEAGVPFLSVTGSDFMEMFVGVGASRVRDLFDSARKLGKAIIFIDEIDSIGRKRGAGLGGGHDEREQTLNQMLSEMDGFEASEGIVLMAATNRPDILDPALLRPGRFDRQVIVPLPELSDRVAILKVHTKGKRIADDVDLDIVARSTPGMSGADLANLINEAALYAVRDGKDEVMAEHIEQARDRIVMGIKRESMVLTDDEKKAIAYHEAGHAVCAAVMPTADPLHKVTIIPSGMALGVTMQLPENDRHLYRSDYMLDRLVVMFGGRVAEEIVFGIVSTGAGDDLVKATAMARSMVREWGMSDEIGPMAWGSQEQVFLGENLMQTRDYSDTTARVIDEEIERILREQLERCRQTLLEYREVLDKVAHSLLEHETIDGKAVERIVESARTPQEISRTASSV